MGKRSIIKMQSDKVKSAEKTRRIEYDWTNEEIAKLITAVRKRRALWDIKSYAYRLPKDKYWHEVVDELGLDLTYYDLKAKWSALRTTFRLCCKRRDLNASLVRWRHFELMHFLEDNNEGFSVNSKETDCLQSGYSDNSDSKFPLVSQQDILEDYSTACIRRLPTTSTLEFDTPYVTQELEVPSTVPALQTIEGNSAGATVMSIDNNFAVSTQQPTMESTCAGHTAPDNDRNNTFCKNILAELQALPEAEAFALRRVLNRAMWDFLESNTTQ